MKESLDIIVPCYNPSIGWDHDLLSRFNQLQDRLRPVTIHCILVNDGSTRNVSEDNIKFLAEHIPSFQYLTLADNQGKGYAIKHGAQKSNSAIMAFTDIDFPYETDCMEAMYQQIKNDQADIVIGHRKENYYEKIPWHRKVLSKGLRRVIQILLHIPVTDTQSGLKFFNTGGKEILLSTTVNRYLFDLELIKLAAKKGARITSIELALREGIELPSFALGTLLRELKNFIKILFS